MCVPFDRLKDAGAAVKALLAGDLIPNAIDLLDAAAAAALGAESPALVVGFDGLREQVDWQCAELSRVANACGGHEGRPLADDTWPRLETAARAAFPATAAVMVSV